MVQQAYIFLMLAITEVTLNQPSSWMISISIKKVKMFDRVCPFCTMRPTTKQSWSPQDLIIHLHARRNCASTTWIGQSVCRCGLLGIDMSFFYTLWLFLPAHCFAFYSLFSSSETSASSSLLFSATTPHSTPGSAWKGSKNQSTHQCSL